MSLCYNDTRNETKILIKRESKKIIDNTISVSNGYVLKSDGTLYKNKFMQHLIINIFL